VVEPLLRQQLEVPHLEEMLLLRRPRKKKRKRVRFTSYYAAIRTSKLTTSTAKEESDEDMGFGLFD
jgi:hypothetical protein